MNHPDLLIERLTQERDDARAALAAVEQAARAAGTWVPVTERFPDCEIDAGSDEVLVSCGTAGVHEDQLYRDAGGARWLQWGKHVTHWMPLPPSPVAGGPGGAERSEA